MPVQRKNPGRGRRRILLLTSATLLTLTMAGCSTAQGEASRGWLPYGASTGADRVSQLWVAMWIAAWLVGALVWGYGVHRFGFGRTPLRFLLLNIAAAVACTLTSAPRRTARSMSAP